MIKYVKDLMAWTTRERPGVPYKDMGGIVSRNYRTWLGHSDVALGSVAVGHLLALIPGVGAYSIPISTLAATLYYGYREFGLFGLFGLTGDYHKAKLQKTKRMRRNKEIDSIGDFISPLFWGIMSATNFDVITAVVAPVGLTALMVILKSIEENGDKA